MQIRPGELIEMGRSSAHDVGLDLAVREIRDLIVEPRFSLLQPLVYRVRDGLVLHGGFDYRFKVPRVAAITSSTSSSVRRGDRGMLTVCRPMAAARG